MSEPFKSKYMTDDEIVVSYRQAKNKANQVVVLSELNLCSKDEIIEVLKRNGVDGRCLPRTPAKKDRTNASQTKKKTHSKMDNKPVNISDVFEFIDSLKAQKNELQSKLLEIDNMLSQICERCQTKAGDVR